MSQNGKRKASSEELQEQSSKRQRLGELGHVATGTNTTVPANLTGQPTTTSTAVPTNVTGPPTTTIYGSIAGQAAPRGQLDISQAPPGQTVGNSAGVGGAVDSNEGARTAPQTGSAGPKRKRRASSPASEEPSLKQSARGQKRAGLLEAGLNDKERGTVQQKGGQLFCMHPVDKKWVPAVFHSAIRADLIAAASARGSYSVKRTRGALENDVTSYLEAQRDWSGERQNWPRIRHNVLNRQERNGWRDDYNGQRAQVWIHTDGRMVIDHDRNPMYRHPDLPDTLSSAIEGWHLEAVMRLDSRILRETIRARLPDARRPPKSRKAETESMYALTAISNKRLRFRHDEGLVAWDSRAVSTEMNNYFRSFIPQASLDRNSNEGGRGLSKAEREHGENLGKDKGGQNKKSGTSSPSTTTQDQATALTSVTMESEGAKLDRASQPAFDGSILPRVKNQTSPSPLAQANGQLLNPYHQRAGQAVDPSPFPFLPEVGFNPYQMHNFAPIPSAYSQENAIQHTASVGPPPPAYFNGTDLAKFSSSTPDQNVQDKLASQPQRTSDPQHPEQPESGVRTSISDNNLRQTNGRTARAGGSRRGRARWRNDDPPVYDAAALIPNGGISTGNRSHDLEHSSESNGAYDHTQIISAPTNTSIGERVRPSGRSADYLGVESRNGYITNTGVNPESTISTGNRRAGVSVQQSGNPVPEAPADDSNHLLAEDGQWSQLGDHPFEPNYGWPTALDLDLLDFPQPAGTYVDPHDSGTPVENTLNAPTVQGSTPHVYYDNSAPLQDGQQNTVWRLDDNETWVLEETPGEMIRNQPVVDSNNTANRHPPADTNRGSLAGSGISLHSHQAGETATAMGVAPFSTTSTAPHPALPMPSSTITDRPTTSENNMSQQAASSRNASRRSRDIPSTSGLENTGAAEDSRPRYAIPTNNFQYATIQTLLAPTRRAFIAAFQDESWRDYVPLNFVPPTDRHLSYQGVFEQLSMDFWDIWTSRFGYDAEVPLLAKPSRIDEFSAAVLLGLPGP